MFNELQPTRCTIIITCYINVVSFQQNKCVCIFVNLISYEH